MFQPKMISSIVPSLRSRYGTRRIDFSPTCFSIVRITKKYSPQSTKFQLAPCHIPVSAQTIAMLSSLCFFLPPSGI